jgi:pyruvate carboxylase
MDVDELIQIVKHHRIDAVHPGYGFLSESDTFAERMWKEAGVVVIGPGWEILAQTGDKLKARQLAEQCMRYLSTANHMLTPHRQCSCVTGSAHTHKQC